MLVIGLRANNLDHKVASSIWSPWNKPLCIISALEFYSLKRQCYKVEEKTVWNSIWNKMIKFWGSAPYLSHPAHFLAQQNFEA